MCVCSGGVESVFREFQRLFAFDEEGLCDWRSIQKLVEHILKVPFDEEIEV